MDANQNAATSLLDLNDDRAANDADSTSIAVATAPSPATATAPAPATALAHVAAPATRPQRRINLALQGGGAHGAFTWGVLDRLLARSDLEFEGLSGSSAGAINAVVLADGWLKGERDGAREALATFWSEVGKLLPPGMVNGGGESVELSPASKLLASWAEHFSPAQINPLELNPLRDLLARLIDFDALRKRSPFKLFVAATQANTGKLRIFREHELTLDMLMASCCLPKLHHPVDIGGEPYWDGGYSANPAVFPLFYECETQDVLLVLLSPLRRDDVPRTAKAIDERIIEMSFNATFMREMQTFARAAEFSDRESASDGMLEAKLRALRVHMIDVRDLASLERTDTKALAHPPFLESLHAHGRDRARNWLATKAKDVGSRSTVDMQKWFA